MLSVRDADAFYGRVQALRSVSLEVEAREVVTLLGANGAGKSTMLRMISGLLRPARGTIEYKGRPIHALATHHIVQQGIAHVPEGRQLFPEMSVAENLELGSFRVGYDERRRDWVLELFPFLKERSGQAAGTLSGGEQQMLAIGRALMAKPSLLLLDEPSMGLSPVMVEQVARAVRRLKDEGLSILIVEQNAALALGVADRAYVLELGVIVEGGATQEVRRSPALRRAYLGDAHA